LIEVMVAAVVLLLVYFGAAQYAARSRTQMDLDESRRVASSIARARLESLRREESFDTLATLVGRDTTYVVGTRSYTVTHAVQAGVPETFASTVTVTVGWNKLIGGNTVPRTLTLTSILGRCIPWDDTGAGGGSSATGGGGGGWGGGWGDDDGGLDEDDDEHGNGGGHH
ncbi:MAG: hypothetical protein Q7W29_02260, partial [bacterium]|nr:hypothetical protein [bacterium]